MINRGIVKASQYFYDAKTKTLKKKEENIQTIESLSKQSRKYINKLSDIGKEVNKTNEVPKPINQIIIITGEDNIVHTYFYDFEYSWDMGNCLSTATIKMPRMNDENVKYWATYQGPVTIYGGYNFKFDKANGQGFQNEQDAVNSLVPDEDISDIKPLFRGSVSRIKEYQTHINIYINSIGSRFKQEIPEDFRQMYINGQNVADTFQAICEFLGVQYICPPKKANETEADTGNSNNSEGDGTENDITQQQETTQNIVNTVKNKVDQANQSTGTENNTDTDTNTDTTNTDTTSNEITNNQEIEVPINGYDDISFDANGMITHSSTAIETSPDMADTLLQMEENPLERYLEDETGIIEKVQKFLDGDMFEELHSNVMDYGAITVQPQSTTSSDISTTNVGDTNVSDLSGNTEGSQTNNTQDASSGQTPIKTHTDSSRRTPIPSAAAISRHQAVRQLSKNYINTLTPEQARDIGVNGKNTYSRSTLKLLLQRSMGRILR